MVGQCCKNQKKQKKVSKFEQIEDTSQFDKNPVKKYHEESDE